jgi:hypothetical protein
MTRSLAGLALVLAWISSAGPAGAAPPTIKATVPFGACRGTPTEVTIEGTNLKGTPELVAPFGFTMQPPSSPNADAGHWKATFTVADDTAIGAYPIRVRTEEGISNPLLFSVGQLPQVAEAEDNSSFLAAQAVPAPVVVEGQAAGNDVDFFRFPGKKGQRIVVDAQCARIGSGVDPTIRLTTATQVYVASADDTPGLLTDARLVATLPEDTEYVVEISDSRYQGGGRPIYRLLIGAVPIAEEVYPIGGRRGESLGVELRGGTLAGPAPGPVVGAARLDPGAGLTLEPLRIRDARSLLPLDVESLLPVLVGDIPELREPADPAAAPVRAAAPVALNGRIDPAGDEDRFVLAVTPGQKLRIEVDASDYGSALDATLRILGGKGEVLANADDTAPPSPGKGKKAPPIASPDPTLDFTVPAGQTEITLALRDLGGRGGLGFPYHIRVVPATGFDLTLDDSQVSIPRGGCAAVGVTVVRKGYNGPIRLEVPDPPAGLTVQPGTIADGQLVGSLTLTAAPDTPFGAVWLTVAGHGQGQGPDGPIFATARKTIVYAAQTVLNTNKQTQVGLMAAPALPAPLTFRALDKPVEVAHGAGGTIPLSLARGEGADAALTVAALPLPPGLSLGEAKIAEKAGDAAIVINAAPEVPLGTMSIALLAKGKLAGTEQTIAVPEITLDVVRPVALELAAPGIELKAGEAVELKGKITRKGTFKEEITVKLDKLPAGLKAEPVKVAPDQSEFTLKVESDAKAAAAEAKAAVALVFQVAKKDYSMPATPLGVKVKADTAQ